MPTTITHTTGAVTPVAVEGYRARRASNTVIGDVINRANPEVTLRKFGLRTGSFRLLFDNQADALDADAVLSIEQVLSISDPDVAALSMSFVIPEGDGLEVEQDRDNANLWWVTVGFQEIKP